MAKSKGVIKPPDPNLALCRPSVLGHQWKGRDHFVEPLTIVFISRCQHCGTVRRKTLDRTGKNPARLSYQYPTGYQGPRRDSSEWRKIAIRHIVTLDLGLGK